MICVSTTERQIKVCTYLREISSCFCLTVLPGPAWVLLSKTYKPLFTPLYGDKATVLKMTFEIGHVSARGPERRKVVTT